MKGIVMFLMVLTGCTVRCDQMSNNNYVFQMPDEDTPAQKESLKKQFDVYWNVPTMQCGSKKIPFAHLYEKYGIIQNENDSFRGDKVAILYDPGLFPALLKNETSGKLMRRNGGVPQEGDLEKHLDEFKKVLNQSVPDPYFDGIGVIDFESWRPVFRQNFGVLVPYKEVSCDVEWKRHWWWPSQWITAEAKSRFEESARTFMQTTLSIAKQMRPYGQWGYYGFPYCFNGHAGKNMEHCADEVPAENDRTYWLWSESTALYPSVYSPSSLDTNQLASFIRGRIHESARVARKNTPILPYFWFRYRDGGYLSQKDLKQALQTMYRSNATGFIIWGSSQDVNTVEKCNNLLDYVQNTFGPAIAKYTKSKSKVDDYFNEDEIPSVADNATDISSIIKPIINATTTLRPVSKDPFESSTENITKTTTIINPELESHWESSETYAQDIVKYIDDDIVSKKGHSFTVDGMNTEEVLKNINESVLLDLIARTLTDVDKKQNIKYSSNRGKPTNNENLKINIPKDIIITSTVINNDYTESDIKSDGETTTLSVSPSTNVLNKIDDNTPEYLNTGKPTEGLIEFPTAFIQSTEPYSTRSYDNFDENSIEILFKNEEEYDNDGNYSSTTNVYDATETETASIQTDSSETNENILSVTHNRKYIIEETTQELNALKYEKFSESTNTTQIAEAISESTQDNFYDSTEYNLKLNDFTDSTSTTETSKRTNYKKKDSSIYEDLTNETVDKKGTANDATSMELTATTDQVKIFKSFYDLI